MPVLIYMESAYRRADGTGVIRCEAMLPGDGQATISNVDPEDFLTAEPYWNSCETCGGFLGADDTENGVLDFIAEIVA